MKKQYKKPGLVIENFTLSECVAAGCSGIGETFNVEENCTSNFSYDELLNTVRDMLGDDWSEADIYMGDWIVKVCKHSSQGVSVFTS